MSVYSVPTPSHPPHLAPLAPFDLVIFGGTGDLALRKLLPALFHRYADGQIVAGARIVGIARDERSDEAYRGKIREALIQFAGEQATQTDVLDGFLALLSYRRLDLSSDSGWPEFAAEFGDAERVRVFYLAVGPDLFGVVSDRLQSHGLVNPKTRVVVEKPLGKDGTSADAINDALARVFNETQIFRIDHYLGKETV